LSADARFLTNELRVRNRDELIPLLESALAEKPLGEWEEVFSGAGFPYGAVNNLERVFRDPQVVHKGLLQTVEHATLGEVKQVGPPVSYSASLNVIRSGPPTLGQHTDEVMKSVLDMSDNDIATLRNEGIIA